MALSVTHSTAADGTFSTDGATAWDAAHTLTGTVSTSQIADDAVTYAKIQDVTSTDRILGRITGGAGVVEELTGANVKTILALAQADISGLTTADSPQFTAVNIGHASDTTITKSAAGVIAVEGKDVYMAGGADVALADGGTGATLADPGGDRILFWDDSAGAVTWLTAGTGLTITDTTITSSGGASLDAITAAAGDQAGISNGDNNIRWNWAKTTNSEIAFEFGESAASTNGTSTSGVPNQVLLKLSTVASSTMSPLSVYSRAAHVFSVSPSAAQILATNGSSSAPAYSFAGTVNSGMYKLAGGGVVLTVSGTDLLYCGASSNVVEVGGSSVKFRFADGSAANPATQFSSSTTDGLFYATGVAVAASGREMVRWVAASAGGGWQIMPEADSNPTTTNLAADDAVAHYNKGDTLVLAAYNNGGTMTYVKLALDGSSTTLVHDTSAP